MMSLTEMQRKFPTHESCLKYLFNARYQRPLKCPKCKRIDSFHFTQGKFVCTCGQNAIFPRTGTLFEGSSVDLTKWFHLLYLIAHHPVLNRDIENLGVSSRTAYIMHSKILHMIHDTNPKGTREQKDRLKKEVIKNSRGVTPEMMPLNLSEYLFRENCTEDPFVELLNLAIHG